MKYFVFFLLTLSFYSCTKKSEIIGKWQLHSIDYSAFYKSIPMDMKENFENNMEIQFAALKDKTYFVFNDDLSIQILLPKIENDVINGTWSISEKKDSLHLRTNEPENFKIIKLDEQQMILKTDESPQRTIFYRKVKN